MKYFVKKMISSATVAAMLISSTAIFNADAATGDPIRYCMYTYGSGLNLSYYSLTQQPQSAVQSRAVIGTDDRKRDGYSGIVRLSNGGTGFVVSDHVIATAAHCVYAGHSTNADIRFAYQDTAYFVNDIEIQLYNDDGTPKNIEPLIPVEVHVPDAFIQENIDAIDYALIYVSEDLSSYGCEQFNLGMPYEQSSSAFYSHDLFVSGIPQVLGRPGEEVGNGSNYVYTGKGKVFIPDNPTEGALYYTCDTSGGQSGAPVYTAYSYTVGETTYVSYTAVAIHKGGGTDSHNGGAAMTSEKIQFYLNNDYVGW